MLSLSFPIRIVGWQCPLQAVSALRRRAAGYLQCWCVMRVDSRLAPVLRTSQPTGPAVESCKKSPRGSDVQLGLKATAEPLHHWKAAP